MRSQQPEMAASTMVFDPLGLRTVFESVQCFLIETGLAGNAGYHHSSCIASQGIFEQSCKFGVSEGNEPWLLLLRQQTNALAESQETLVDVDSLSEPLALPRTGLLIASQVHQEQSRLEHPSPSLPADCELEDGVGTGGHLIAASGVVGSPLQTFPDG